MPITDPTPRVPVRYQGQAVAIEADLRKSAQRDLTVAHHALQAKTMLEGQDRVYTKRFDEDAELASETQRVQVTVKEMIEATTDILARLFDATAAKDYTNASGRAVADVVIGDRVLVEKAPVPYLLFLEKQLTDLTTFVRKLPTHDPATTWELDDPRGVYRSAPVQTTRSVQEPRVNVVVQATERHPAQVASYTENVVKGWWTTTRTTGAISVAERAELIGRIETLMRAVHVAREAANRVEADQPRVGDAILAYLFTPTPR